MAPIRFQCQAMLPLSAEEIAGQILELERWPEFTGYGFLPGIKQAEFEVRTPDVVGTRIRVINTDGSSHVEDIEQWHVPHLLRLRMHDFSPPLSRLASEFHETWEFHAQNEATLVVRSFELKARSALTHPLLWLISRWLRKAITRHLEHLRRQASAEIGP